MVKPNPDRWTQVLFGIFFFFFALFLYFIGTGVGLEGICLVWLFQKKKFQKHFSKNLFFKIKKNVPFVSFLENHVSKKQI